MQPNLFRWSSRNIVGDSIHTMGLRDLKQMEGKLEKAIIKIRARKVCSINCGTDI
jgi:hypothetical protein